MKSDVRRRTAIALRRFAVEGLPCKKHRVYFGCSQGFMREFLRGQFRSGESWKGFGTI